MASKPKVPKRARLEREPGPDPLAAWPYPDDALYFMSGSNDPTEIRVAAAHGQNVGVAAQEVRPRTEAALAQLADHEGQERIRRSRFTQGGPRIGTGPLVFVDSGAFSEVKFGAEGPSWPKPISDDEWRRRLDLYDRLADSLGPQLFAVAPDKVADQDATLARQRQYAPAVRRLAEKGANVLVPVQKGARRMVDFYADELAALGFDAGDERVYAAIPLKKDATSLEEVEQFVGDARERFGLSCEADPDSWDLPRRKRFRAHLLGLGVYSPDYRPMFDAVKRACPTAIVTSDSVRIRAMVGEERPITQALAHAKALGDKHPKRAALEATNALVEASAESDAIAAGWYDSELDSSPADAEKRALTLARRGTQAYAAKYGACKRCR